MKYFISLLFFAILIAGLHQRRKCFAVITSEIISELRQIILKAGLKESQLDKFLTVVRISIEVAPDIDLSKYLTITEATPNNVLALSKKVRAAGLDRFTSDIRKDLEAELKAFEPKLSPAQIQQTIDATEIDVFETLPLQSDERITEFMTDLVYFIYDVITNTMNLPANSPYAPIVTPQVKQNINKAVLKAGLQESQAISFLKITRVLTKLGLKVDKKDLEQLAIVLPDLFVTVVGKLREPCSDESTPDIKKIIEQKITPYASNVTPCEVQKTVRSYEIVALEMASIKDDAHVSQVVNSMYNIIGSIIHCRKSP